MPASLNDIYKSIGELTSTVRSLAEKMDDNERRNVTAIDQANVSRAKVHGRLDDVVLRMTHVETDLASLKNRTEAMEAVTNDVKEMRQKAQGAGTLGHWLIRFGVGVVAFAGWLGMVFTWITGRPPP